MPNLNGLSLGRYHILEQLGEGGMATVYKAYDTRLETEVAVKIIRTENLAPNVLNRVRKRFEREAKALAKLNHPNIVQVIDYGEYDGIPYLVMPYLPGGTLKGKISGSAMPYLEAAQLLTPIARALDYAHRHKIIHRDVKSSNILITEDGEPMLSDFGVAKLFDEEETVELTGTGIGIGTPEYMAPEQFQGGVVDRRADIYSLGVVLFEMVAGRKPYQAETPAAIIWKQASEPLPRPSKFIPGLPKEIEQILLKALAKAPENRYQSMSEFAWALEDLVLVQEQERKQQEELKRKAELQKTKKLSGHPTRVLWAILGVVGVALVFGFLNWGNFSSPEQLIPTLTIAAPPLSTIIFETSPTSEFTATPIATKAEAVSNRLVIAGTPLIPQEISVANVENLEILTKLNVGADVSMIRFSPDGRFLTAVVGNSSIQIWNYLDGKLLSTIEQQPSVIRDIILTNETITAATCKSVKCQDGGEIITWQLSNQEQIKKLDFPDAVINLSHDEKAILAHYLNQFDCTTGYLKKICARWDIELWDIKDNSYTKLEKLDTATYTFFVQDRYNFTNVVFPQIIFTRDAKSFAIGVGSSINIRKTLDANNSILLEDFNWSVSSINFSPDENLIAASNDSQYIRIWNTQDGSLLQEINRPPFPYIGSNVTFSPDGSLILTLVGIWSVADWELLYTFNYDEADISITSIAFSPDGKLLATGGVNTSNIYLWGVHK